MTRFNIDELTVSQVEAMPYSDFVATINQTNVPPGAYSTLMDWKLYSGLRDDSRLIEVACSTGFTSRELAGLAGCVAHGFDLSPAAIERAVQNAGARARDGRLRYDVCDGYDFRPLWSPTHVAVGAALGFFPDPDRMMDRILSWFDQPGYVLGADFSYRDPSEEAVRLRRDTFGIVGQMRQAEDVHKIYEGLNLYFCRSYTPLIETPGDIASYCTATIRRFVEQSGGVASDVAKAAYERLLGIKRATNTLRRFQTYHIFVYHHEGGRQPRYVELF
jgi:SAM-dependent methyltransferase